MNNIVSISTGDIVYIGDYPLSCIYKVLDRRGDDWLLGSASNSKDDRRWILLDYMLKDGTVTQNRILPADIARLMSIDQIATWACRIKQDDRWCLYTSSLLC